MSGSFDSNLLGLFKEEVAELTLSLNKGLVSLEQSPSPTLLDSLMRAAHSIKGASRAMGLLESEKVAHEMEEILVKAQKGTLTINQKTIDILLHSTDLISHIAKAFGENFDPWLASNKSEIEDTVKKLFICHSPENVPAAHLGFTNPNDMAVIASNTQDQASLIRSQKELSPVFASLFLQELQSLSSLLEKESSNPQPDKARIDSILKSIYGAGTLVEFTEFTQAIELIRGHAVSMKDSQGLIFFTKFLMELSNQQPEKVQSFFNSKKQELKGLFQSHPPTITNNSQETINPQSSAILNQRKTTLNLDNPAKNVSNREGQQETKDSVVRVTAQSLTRLMGLAGESLVEARWLAPFSQSLLKLKREEDRLLDQMNELAQNQSEKNIKIQRDLIFDIRDKLAKCILELNSRVQEFENHARRSDDLNSRLYNEVITSRMRPFGDGAQSFPRMIRDLARDMGKKVCLEIIGESTPVDRDVLEKLDAPLNHLLRNAVDHGIEIPEKRQISGKPETGTIRLEVRHNSGMLSIFVADDGNGISMELLKNKICQRKLSTPEMISRMSDGEILDFLFLPGFSTRETVTEISGRGVGLDVVHNMITSVGGSVRIINKPKEGTTFQLQLPLTLSVIRAVLVEIAGEPYAFPHNRIERLLKLSRNEIHFLENRQYFQLDGENIGLLMANQVFRASGVLSEGDLFIVLFRNSNNNPFGIVVDCFRGEQDLVVRTLDARLGKVPNISSAAILDDGSPVLIVDVDDISRSIERIIEEDRVEQTNQIESNGVSAKKKILIVDDSITVREVEKQLLQSRGYDVTVAVDGADGWNALRENAFDLVVTDIDMPRMNGLEFTRNIKQGNRVAKIPVIIVSHKDREEDRFKGLEAGANHYLTKSSFHDDSLILAIEKLIGKP